MSFFRATHHNRRQRDRNRADWTFGAIFGSLDMASGIDPDPWYLIWGWRFAAGAFLAVAVIGAVYFGVTELLFPPDVDPAMQLLEGIESDTVTSSTLPDANVADVLARFGG